MLVRMDVTLAKNVRQLSNMLASCSPSRKFDLIQGFSERNSIT